MTMNNFFNGGDFPRIIVIACFIFFKILQHCTKKWSKKTELILKRYEPGFSLSRRPTSKFHRRRRRLAQGAPMAPKAPGAAQRTRTAIREGANLEILSLELCELTIREFTWGFPKLRTFPFISILKADAYLYFIFIYGASENPTETPES